MLGVRIEIYLADYEQRSLHPVPLPGGRPKGGSLNVETTLAGRAFREIRMLPTEGGRPCLWVPLLDGVERLGVLAVRVTDQEDLYDPALRTQCRWVSILLGHLVVLTTQYGDALDLLRLRRPRTVAGELIWSVLPPLTAGVDGLIVSGVIEPRYEVGGDAFDYSLSQNTATLLILDAVGHDLRSGMIAAAVLAAHRSSRRAGHGLYEQARSIDEMISEQFPRGSFATAVLAQINVATGRMRYLNAGHPHPLIMRSGKIVKPLTSGLRPPLGIGASEVVIAEESPGTGWCCIRTESPRRAIPAVPSSGTPGSSTSSGVKRRPGTRRRKPHGD
jgi:hypothetical protein